ncbi:MAG: bifunctional tetrahydrofolate synthase/dihydrofolate synthase [Pseudomonadota bacterium]
MSRPTDLAGWLAHLESRNRDAIVLGLERVRTVADRLGLKPACPVITVGGTNGKGSVCAYLEAMLVAAGLRVGCYTSPHLLYYNERVRIDGHALEDGALCEAFEAVEVARGDIPLTYFEQGTLAALWCFGRTPLDVLVLEVGMGGRLDAVNLWDPDCAIVTSVDLDHQAFLGDTREAIGFEKAGIYRPGRPAICGDASPPASLIRHATEIGARLMEADKAFCWAVQDAAWTLWINAGQDTDADVYPALPMPAMAGHHQLGNAACAIAALHTLRSRLPVSRQALRLGLTTARQPGRFQVVGQTPLRILDVAHNPHAARSLAANLAHLQKRLESRQAPFGKIIAVLALLADKDADGVIQPLLPLVGRWHTAGLAGPRGRPGAELAELLTARGARAEAHDTVLEAWQEACREAGAADTICAFGSFHTVAELLTDIQAAPSHHG